MKLCIITTGGTIAEHKTSDHRAHLSGEQLLSGVRTPVGCTFTIRDIFDLPSTHLGFSEMLNVAKTIWTAIESDVDGVVVTHGTDTLEETSYFADLVIDTQKPVVFTAAMIPPGVAGADGAANLRDAIVIASSDRCGRLGVLVTLAGEIHPARDVVKHHSMSIGAFKSPEFGPLGMIDEDRVYLARLPLHSQRLSMPVREPLIEGIKCYAGMSDRLIRAASDQGVEGIILETLGSGQVPPSIMPAIRGSIQKGMVIVATARSPMGRLLRDHYGMPTRVAGDEKELREAGVVFSDLPGTKARIKLWIVLGSKENAKMIPQVFDAETRWNLR